MKDTVTKLFLRSPLTTESLSLLLGPQGSGPEPQGCEHRLSTYSRDGSGQTSSPIRLPHARPQSSLEAMDEEDH